MSVHNKFAAFIIGLFIILIVINLVVWYVTSREIKVECYLSRGQQYKIRSRTYIYPDLPTAKGSATPYLLNENFMCSERALLKRIVNMFDTINIQVWPSGGTLLGLIRHKSILPWDDDCDLHTSNENIPFFFSQSFVDVCRIHDLEILVISAVDKNKALTREGGGIRLRRMNTNMPVCDIFFVGTFCDSLIDLTKQKRISTKNTNLVPSQRERSKRYKDQCAFNKVAKIDTWNKGDYRFCPSFNKKEVWDIQDVFPLQKKIIDDIRFWIPNNPKALLTKQYNDKCLKEIYVRNSLISHAYPFTEMDFVFKKY